MVPSSQIQKVVEQLFKDIQFTSEPKALYDPLRYMIEIGGKRLRPTLCLTAYSLFKDGFPEEILQPAELVHLDLIASGVSGQKRLSAAAIGTAMHTCMERIDFARALEEGLPYITQTVEKLHEKGILTDEEFQEVRFEDIDAFFRTETGERAARAPKLKHEQEFLLQKEINGVPAVVQGVIDCWFEDEKGLVLIDYKNSWAADDQAEEEIVDRYAGQVRLYREALELATGKPVSESWLYLFRSRRFVPVFLNK